MFKVGDIVYIDKKFETILTESGVRNWHNIYGDDCISGTVEEILGNNNLVIRINPSVEGFWNTLKGDGFQIIEPLSVAWSTRVGDIIYMKKDYKQVVDDAGDDKLPFFLFVQEILREKKGV